MKRWLICFLQKLLSWVVHIVEFILNRPLIHYLTFCTETTLAIANYVSKLIRIDINYFIRGASGFSHHQIVRVCCCKCAVIDDCTTADPIDVDKLKKEIYYNQADCRDRLIYIMTIMLTAIKCCCCFYKKETGEYLCCKSCADCFNMDKPLKDLPVLNLHRNMTNHHTDAEHKVELLMVEIRALKKERTDLQTRCRDLEEDKVRCDVEINALKARCIDLKEDKVRRDVEINALKARCRDLEKEVGALKIERFEIKL